MPEMVTASALSSNTAIQLAVLFHATAVCVYGLYQVLPLPSAHWPLPPSPAPVAMLTPEVLPAGPSSERG